MDLNDFDTSYASENGVKFTLLNPKTYEPTDIIFTLSGMDCSKYRNQKKLITNKRMNKMVRKKEVDVSETEKEDIDLLANCTLGWSGILEGEKQIKFSVENAKDLYTKHRWIFEQVNEFIGNRANFFSTV
jgi:hypothetical protein